MLAFSVEATLFSLPALPHRNLNAGPFPSYVGDFKLFSRPYALSVRLDLTILVAR